MSVSLRLPTSSCYHLSLRTYYSPQHFSVQFFSQGEIPSSKSIQQLMNNELDRIWKEVAMVQHLPGKM